MRIAIDIGHCSTGDQGAVSADGLSEHAFWVSKINIIRAGLEKLGHVVRIFRREDYGRSIAAECRAINAWGADIAVSLHLNSSDSTQATGHEVIHYPGSAKGIKMATAINDNLDLVVDLTDRGVKTPWNGRGDTFLKSCAAPAVIVEAAFLSNPDDVGILRRNGDVVASAVVNGIHAYSLTV